MITILRRRVARKFGSVPWRSRSQHDLASLWCPAHNFVIWSGILKLLKLLHRNDHRIETTCRTQHVGRYLEGQGHGTTLQQIVSAHTHNLGRNLEVKGPAWPCSNIVSSSYLHRYLKWGLQLFHRNDHHIESKCRALYLGRYLIGQGHNMILQHNCVRPITSFFEARL